MRSSCILLEKIYILKYASTAAPYVGERLGRRSYAPDTSPWQADANAPGWGRFCYKVALNPARINPAHLDPTLATQTFRSH